MSSTKTSKIAPITIMKNHDSHDVNYNEVPFSPPADGNFDFAKYVLKKKKKKKNFFLIKIIFYKVYFI
jgi:hypothetical protein